MSSIQYTVYRYMYTNEGLGICLSQVLVKDCERRGAYVYVPSPINDPHNYLGGSVELEGASFLGTHMFDGWLEEMVDSRTRSCQQDPACAVHHYTAHPTKKPFVRGITVQFPRGRCISLSAECMIHVYWEAPLLAFNAHGKCWEERGTRRLELGGLSRCFSFKDCASHLTSASEALAAAVERVYGIPADASPEELADLVAKRSRAARMNEITSRIRAELAANMAKKVRERNCERGVE